MSVLRIATAAADAEREAALVSVLSDRDDVEIVMRCVDRVELLAAIRGADLDAVLAVGTGPWVDHESIQEAATKGVRFVALRTSTESGRMSEMGVTVLDPEASVQAILAACVRGTQVPRAPMTHPSSGPRGKVIAVWGPKGAPGRTTVAIEVAYELARQEARTLLIDADTYGGDILQLLGVIEEMPTIVWAARMAAKGELDPATLALELRRVGQNGPILLPGIPRAELWPEISPYGWRELLEVVRASTLFVVCDVGFCIEPEASFGSSGEPRNHVARTTIGDADHVLAVCNASPIGIKSFLWAYDQLRELKDDDDVFVIANRVRPRDERELTGILRRNLSKRPFAYLPDRPQEFARAISEGATISERAPGSDLNAPIRTVVAGIGGQVVVKGALSRLGRRR